MKNRCLKWVVTGVLLCAVSAAHASFIRNVDSNGQLLGATGIELGGDVFNLVFSDGTCVAVFDGCDELSDFAFNDAATAQAAATFLFEQLLLDVAEGNFDTNPALTNGCSNGRVCSIFIPYAVDVFSVFIDIDAVRAANTQSVDNSLLGDFISFRRGGNGISGVRDLSFPQFTNRQDDGEVFAVFSRVSPSITDVPEPSTLSAFALGVFGLFWRKTKGSKNTPNELKNTLSAP